MPSTTIGRGNVLLDFIVGPTLTPVAVAGSTAAEQSFTILGLMAGDVPDVSCSISQTPGIGIGNARVPSNNILTIEFTNSTAGSLTPVSGIYAITICRPEFLPLPTNAV